MIKVAGDRMLDPPPRYSVVTQQIENVNNGTLLEIEKERSDQERERTKQKEIELEIKRMEFEIMKLQMSK